MNELGTLANDPVQLVVESSLHRKIITEMHVLIYWTDDVQIINLILILLANISSESQLPG